MFLTMSVSCFGSYLGFQHVGTVAVTRTILVCLVPLVCLCFNLMTFQSPLFICGFHLGRKLFHIKCIPLTFYHFCMLLALPGAFCDESYHSEQIQRTEQNLKQLVSKLGTVNHLVQLIPVQNFLWREGGSHERCDVFEVLEVHSRVCGLLLSVNGVGCWRTVYLWTV